MRIVFDKAKLPFLKNTLHAKGSPRDSWWLGRLMQDQNGLQHQLPAEISLFARSAAAGDAWGACELARNYYTHAGDLFLPEALRLWRIAMLQNDPGATWDIENRKIRERILAYRAPSGCAYREIEMRCALLTEWILEELGKSPWSTLSNAEREKRCRTLVREVCPILGIPDTEVEWVPGLLHNGTSADGVAYWDGRIQLRLEVLPNLERVVEIIFHELGHIICFEVIRKTERATAIKERYGLTEERIRSWEAPTAEGIHTSEQDPDTLAYGVYTLFATFFLP